MDPAIEIIQTPAPSHHLLMFQGDTVTFTLAATKPFEGSAWLRTNIGRSETIRREIIQAVEKDLPPRGHAWFDIPMIRTDTQRFQLTLPLCDVGHFEAKGFCLGHDGADPLWAPGPNTVINVEPADTICGNTIYNAFVRQFGPNKAGRFFEAHHRVCIETLDHENYVVIPPSGTFRDLMAELDFIIGNLGCRLIQLLPIHPTPTTYGRMGRFGSPYAALSFTAVDPSLAEFDPKATPLEQFIELVDAIHAHQAKVLIDIAINHTGWAASIHETHPEWLIRGADGHIEVPGAWGVRWEDLTKLDYRHHDLWRYMADVFLTWCRRGVDGFRCDAGYMIPVPAWQYIIAVVREAFPGTLFFLEGLGGKMSVTRDLLNRANFNWAYSELFQNYDRGQIEHYLPLANDISAEDGLTVHFAETHDNPRLAARSVPWAKMRTALCALLSHQGAFAFTNGVEWLATEKVNVHESPSLNWGATDNQIAEIRRLTRLLKRHPTFHDQVRLTRIDHDPGNTLMVRRDHLPTGKQLLIVVNLDITHPHTVVWPADTLRLTAPQAWDLLSGAKVDLGSDRNQSRLDLAPAQIACLSPEVEDLALMEPNDALDDRLPARVLHQRLRTWAMKIHRFYHGLGDVGTFDPDRAVAELRQNPRAFCRKQNPTSRESRVVLWQWPSDSRRQVMLPPNHFLMLEAPCPFRARIAEAQHTLAVDDALPLEDGRFFVLFNPLSVPGDHRPLSLHLSVYHEDRCEHCEAPLLLLHNRPARVKTRWTRPSLRRDPAVFLSANSANAMLQVPVAWGQLYSRYDALLAANLDARFPADRWIMFSRLRAWVVHLDYSQALDHDHLDWVAIDSRGRGTWLFRMPAGRGSHVMLLAQIKLSQDGNRTQIRFTRQGAADTDGALSDQQPVELILRPDIESRQFHQATKAYTGPETHWPQAVQVHGDGFDFRPEANRHLRLRLSAGTFVHEPEWHYMVRRDLDAQRGFDPDTDLFSPGYFSVHLDGNQSAELTAAVNPTADVPPPTSDAPPSYSSSIPAGPISAEMPFEAALRRALQQFVVRRGELKSIIAGYPWFLDWGRDSLIVVRGLIAAGETDTARRVLKQFGQFEANGTLPNMIRGENASNRDTSDAPLWFIVACHDLVRAEGDKAFLAERCGNRTIEEIIVAIGRAMVQGTPNGIWTDPASGLLYSPAHFTWMDTNHPAGTPRQGYAIEIQALWFAALQFLHQIDRGQEEWGVRASQVQTAVNTLFAHPAEGFLIDCLHASASTPAAKADADDALRPNQLLAITLGLITDDQRREQILKACEILLIPGGIRSLADRTLTRPLEIVHNGQLLNDPYRPYQGRYAGDEDTSRKPAYHNGTAWTWLFPSYCEAWLLTYGPAARPTAQAWLHSATTVMDTGCLGQIPEIMDGDFPHRQRGCLAQAWGVSELLRVWILSEALGKG